jgi:hypothetical protein
MKQKIILHKICAITLFIVMTLSMVACSAKMENDSKQGTSGNKGRYVEKEITLPKLDDNERILQISRNDEGGLRVYSIVFKEKNKKADIYQYDLKEDQTFEKKKTEWLQNLNIEMIEEEQSQYIFDCGKTEYAYFNYKTKGKWINQIFKTTDGKQREILPVKEWEKAKKKADYVTIGVTASGNIYMQDTDDLCKYDEDSQSFVSVLDTQQYLRDSLIAGANQLILLKNNGDSFYSSEYSVWKEDELEEAPQTFSFEPTYDIFGFVNDNNDIITVDNTGIHQVINGTMAIQLVVDGSMNMMYATSSYPKQIIQDKEENYYVLYYLIDKDEFAVMEYSYDPEVSAIPETTLTVYSLITDLWTREAAVVFQREHPNVSVELRVAMTDENATATQEDYIRQLNTELLNGEGPDVLVMDGLPLNSYISKGTLLDMRDVIQSLVDKGELFENIVSVYKQEDGSYYTFPVNINIPLILSHKEAASSATSLEKIAEYVKKYNGPMGFGSQSWEKLMQNFLPPCLNQLISDNEAEVDKIEEFLTNLNAIYQLGEYGERKEESGDDYYYICKVTEGLQMAFVESGGFYDISLPYGLAKYIGGDLSALNQTFYPVSSLSINKNSKNIDLSKEFIACLLSEKMQENDMQTGFPVNKKAFESRKSDKKKQELQWKCQATDENGKTVMVPYGWPDDQTIDLYESLCGNVYNVGNQNQYILDVFITSSQDYADGKINAHDAAQTIADKLQMYLKE